MLLGRRSVILRLENEMISGAECFLADDFSRPSVRGNRRTEAVKSAGLFFRSEKSELEKRETLACVLGKRTEGCSAAVRG